MPVLKFDSVEAGDWTGSLKFMYLGLVYCLIVQHWISSDATDIRLDMSELGLVL